MIKVGFGIDNCPIRPVVKSAEFGFKPKAFAEALRKKRLNFGSYYAESNIEK